MTVQAIHTVREFNRFYTGLIGALDYQGHLGTPYSLTEARVLYELAHHEPMDVAELRDRLHLDAGYLSRLLTRFAERSLITRERSTRDARRQVVTLTAVGHQQAALLDERSTRAVATLLDGLSAADRVRLAEAMHTVRQSLERGERPSSHRVRDLQPGDLGWVIQRHGALYAAEYGWNTEFEALVARIVADFADSAGRLAGQVGGTTTAGAAARRERAWIAESAGMPVGCVFCVPEPAGDGEVARLRLLLVEPSARGLGVGARLINECVRFARHRGYRELRLWTNDVLVAARRLYERAGFTLRSSSPHHSFGADLVGQEWSLRL